MNNIYKVQRFFQSQINASLILLSALIITILPVQILSAQESIRQVPAKPALSNIEDIQFNDDDKTLKISVESPVESRNFTLESPPRIVIDLIDSRYKPLESTLDVASDQVHRVRIAQYSRNIVRVVLDLRRSDAEYEVNIVNDNIVVSLRTKDGEDIAEKEPADFLEEHSKTVERSDLVNQGIAAESSGDWEKATEIYEKILQKHPDDINILKRKSDIEFKLGNYEQGIKDLEKIASIKSDAETWSQISRAYSISNKPEKALDAIKKAVDLDPGNQEYLKSQASLANWTGDYKTAKSSYEKLLNLDPGEKSNLYKMGNVMNWTGDSDEAVHYYKKYLSHEPGNTNTLLNLAKVESFRGNYDASINTLKKYSEIKGRDEEYSTEMSRALIFAGRPNSGLNLLEKELEDNPDNYDLNVLKTFALLNSRRYSAAGDSLERTITLDPGNEYNKDFRRFITTPLKSHLDIGGRVYFDSDDIVITHQEIGYEHVLSPETSLNFLFLSDQLTADDDSPFARMSGGDYIYHFNTLVGIDHFFNPDFKVKAMGGYAFTDEDSSPSYDINIAYWPSDTIKFTLQNSLEYYLVSPLSVEEDVRSFRNSIGVNYQPFIGYSVNGWAAMNFYTDDNNQWEAMLNPRKEILRLEHFNLDLGLSGYWFGFDKDLDNGYFDPGFYQRYLAHGYGYIKIDDDNGIAFNGGMGVQDDDISEEFSFSANASVETFIGIYRNWFFRFGGSYYNTRLPSGAFDAYSLQIRLTNRF